MRRIFNSYGGVIIVVVALVALMGLVFTLMQPAGIMWNAFGSITGMFTDKAETLIDDAGNGGSGGPGGNGGPGHINCAEGHVSATGEIRCTWEDISAADAVDAYALGNWKSFETTDGIAVTMEIVAFNADAKADGSGTAAITWISKDLVAEHKMNGIPHNDGGWEKSQMRKWLQGEFYEKLPAEVKSSIVNVNKTYGDYNGGSYVTKECSDNVWIPSRREVTADDFIAGCMEDTGAFYFKSSSTLTKTYGGSPAVWWLRTACDDYSYEFCFVYKQGGTGCGSAACSYGVALGFCT